MAEDVDEGWRKSFWRFEPIDPTAALLHFLFTDEMVVDQKVEDDGTVITLLQGKYGRVMIKEYRGDEKKVEIRLFKT